MFGHEMNSLQILRRLLSIPSLERNKGDVHSKIENESIMMCKCENSRFRVAHDSLRTVFQWL